KPLLALRAHKTAGSQVPFALLDADRLGLDDLIDVDRQIGFLEEEVVAAHGHAFGPDVEAAAPELAGVLVGRDLPDAPDAFALVVAGIGDVVLAEIALAPVALAVGDAVAAGD